MVMIKPGAVHNKFVGEIISRYEKTGLALERMSMEKYPRSLIAKLYREHKGKDFYEPLVETICSQKIVVMVLSGPEGTVRKVRKINGTTNPLEAAPGTIRGDFGLKMGPDNVVHASDSKESARREIGLFFPDIIKKGSDISYENSEV